MCKKINTGVYELIFEAMFKFVTGEVQKGLFTYTIEKTEYTGEMAWKTNYTVLMENGEIYQEQDSDYHHTKKGALQCVNNVHSELFVIYM